MVIKCKYNVTDISKETPLLNNPVNIAMTLVDGVEVPQEVERDTQEIDDDGKPTGNIVPRLVPNCWHQFDEVGEHIAEFYLEDDKNTLGHSAFSHTPSLVECEISDGVLEIDTYCFYECENLKKVTLPDSIETIASYAFGGLRNLEEINIPDSVVAIGEYAFDSCVKANGLTIPSSLSVISNNAFMNSNIEFTEIGDNITEIGDGAFINCSGLVNVTIPDSVTKIGDGAFLGCKNLEKITIGSGVETVPAFICQNCSKLTEVTFGENVTEISFEAFRNCTSLTNIKLPETLTMIGNYAFQNCGDNMEVEFTSMTPPELGDNPFNGTISRGMEVNVPDDAEDAYNNEEWLNKLAGLNV